MITLSYLFSILYAGIILGKESPYLDKALPPNRPSNAANPAFQDSCVTASSPLAGSDIFSGKYTTKNMEVNKDRMEKTDSA